jgi:hypothetical protein
LLRGCPTDAQSILIPYPSVNSKNFFPMKLVPFYVMMVFGIANW